MSCPAGERTLLPPARDPPVDQRSVQGLAVGRTDAEPLGDARSESLDQHVRVRGEPSHECGALGGLEVDRHRRPPAPEGIGRDLGRSGAGHGTVHSQHLRAEVGQHHAGERSGREPRELDHAHTGEGTTHRLDLLVTAATLISAGPDPTVGGP